MAIPIEVLIVDDSEPDAILEARALARGGFDARWLRIDTPGALGDALRCQRWDVILCDAAGPWLTIHRAVALVRAISPATPVLLVSGRRREELQHLIASPGEVSGILDKDRLAELPVLVETVTGRSASARECRESLVGPQDTGRPTPV